MAALQFFDLVFYKLLITRIVEKPCTFLKGFQRLGH